MKHLDCVSAARRPSSAKSNTTASQVVATINSSFHCNKSVSPRIIGNRSVSFPELDPTMNISHRGVEPEHSTQGD